MFYHVDSCLNKRKERKLKVQCPICHEQGYVQQRYHSVRVGHYKGYKGKTRIIEWHATNIEAVLVVNKGEVSLDEHGELTLFTKNEENSHGLPSSPQTHNLENKQRGLTTPDVQRSRARN